jgi:hypothetical protein
MLDKRTGERIMAYLNEAAAWREIARKIVEGEWGRYGLCREINVLLLEEKTIDKEVAWTMVRRLRTYVKWHVWAYPQGMEEEGRVLAALWLALDAEEEPVTGNGGHTAGTTTK